MSATFGSRQEALEHLRVADNKWTEAVRTFRPYAERLRRLADAAEAQRKAFLYAEVCGVKWKPRENAHNLSLAPDLEPPNREGPPNLWAKFEKAQKRFGDALAGKSLMAIAQAFGDMAQAVTDIADALDQSEAVSQASSMIRLLIGLRILRGPRRTTPPPDGSGRRRVLLGICCVVIASAATHSGAGRAASPSPIAKARASIARHVQDPSALFLTAVETRRTLGHVKRVDLSFGVYGSDFSAVVLYKPLSGSTTGQVIINRLPDANPSSEEKGCRARGHKVTRVRVGRYRTYYCADDITFGYLWRWDHRIYTVDTKYYGGVRPAGLQALISHMTYIR